MYTQPGDRKPSDRTVKLTSEEVSSQKVRPEAASASLPALAGVGQAGGGNKEKTREVTYLHSMMSILSPPNQKR